MVKFADVDEAFNTRGDFGRSAELLAILVTLPVTSCALGDRVRRLGEGVAQHLLHTKGNAIVLEVDLEDSDGDWLAFFDVLLDGLLAEPHAVVRKIAIRN